MALEGFEAAALQNWQAKRRLDFFYNRAREELYNVQRDPNALDNLTGNEGEHIRTKTGQ